MPEPGDDTPEGLIRITCVCLTTFAVTVPATSHREQAMPNSATFSNPRRTDLRTIRLDVSVPYAIPVAPGQPDSRWFRPDRVFVVLAPGGRKGWYAKHIEMSGVERLPASHGRPARDGKAVHTRTYSRSAIAGQQGKAELVRGAVRAALLAFADMHSAGAPPASQSRTVAR